MRRALPAGLAVVALLAAGVFVVVPRMPSLDPVLAIRPDGQLLAAGALAVLIAFVGSGTALWAASGRVLSWRRAVATQFMAAAVNRVLPGGVAGGAVTVRSLMRSGAHVGEAGVALAAVGLAQLFVIVTLVGITGGTGGFGAFVAPLSSPRLWSIVAALAAVLAIVVLLARRAVVRRFGPRLRGAAVDARTAAAHLWHSPRDAALVVLGCAGVRCAQLVALWCVLGACGAGVSVLTALGAYTSGVLATAAVPTPGGVGSGEAGAAGALGLLGTAAAPALAGLVLFRVLIYAVPLVPGLASALVLRHPRWSHPHLR